MGCSSSKEEDLENDELIRKKMSALTALHPAVEEDPQNISGILGFEQVNQRNSNDTDEIFKKIKKIGKSNSNFHCYLIRSTKSFEEYAYKIINISDSNNELSKKIMNDIEILKNLNHPNIILLKNAYFSDNKKYLYVFTEYADDGDLQMKLDEHQKNNKNFEEDTLLDWLMQICLALKYIHNENILHRDIKPSNIFLMKQKIIKLGDFGVAKSLTSSLKYTKTMVATPQYLAPEIIKKEGYSFKADIFSLGVTFFQLIYLAYPFEGVTDEEIQKNISEGITKKISTSYKYDKKFLELINDMMANRPDERPSAEEILEKGIIKTRMECYLQENGFNNLRAKKTIDEYENEIKDNNSDKKEGKMIVEDLEPKDFILEKNDENEKKRFKKAIYDLNRQMTLMDKELLKKSNTIK